MIYQTFNKELEAKKRWETIGDVDGFTPLSLVPLDDGTFMAACHHETDGADVELEFSIRDGRVVFTRFTVSSNSVTTDTVRVPIGKLRTEIARLLRNDPDFADAATHRLANEWADLTPEERESLKEESAANREKTHEAKGNIRSYGRLGRPPLTDEFLAQVAETYISLFSQNQEKIAKALTKQLEADLKKPGLNENTVKSWIGACRKNDWLEPASKGAPVGEPGQRLLKWRESKTEPQ